MSPRYLVLGPTQSYCEVITDDGQGPWYDYRECFVVDAPNRNTAKWAAARHPRATWPDENRGANIHPLSGVEALDYGPDTFDEGDPDEADEKWIAYDHRGNKYSIYIDATETPCLT